VRQPRGAAQLTACKHAVSLKGSRARARAARFALAECAKAPSAS
jgi:hypothetical protein